MTERLKAVVTLRPITADTVRTICALATSDRQKHFVASVAESIAEAYFAPAAEIRAVYADAKPVGFMQWRDEGGGNAYLWRFLIDRTQQHRGFGGQALLLLAADLRNRGFRRMTLSYVIDADGPRDFYARLGFIEGDIGADGEQAASRQL